MYKINQWTIRGYGGHKVQSDFIYVDKGWGYEKWIVNCPEYCGKLLFFDKGKKCSWHYHILKDETFYIHSGKVLLTYGTTDDITAGQAIILNKGDKFHVPRGLRHQILALEETNLFEFSTQHFDSDSYRVMPGD